MNQQFLCGSRYFFSDYPDFEPHDTDYIILVDSIDNDPSIYVGYYREGDVDYFIAVRKPVEDYFNWVLNGRIPMRICQFLIPEFVEAIGFTIDMLPRLRYKLSKLNPKHAYYKVLYDAYMENGSFTLTQAQRDEAYKVYKQSKLHS